jgi:uncharacterized membrane protein
MTTSGAPNQGLSPQLAGAIAYVGGLVTGIVVLAVEKEDRFVRFHAMQSIVFFIAVLVAHLALSGVPFLGKVLYVPFLMGVVGIWAFLIYQAFNGRRYKLPYFGDFAERQLR